MTSLRNYPPMPRELIAAIEQQNAFRGFTGEQDMLNWEAGSGVGSDVMILAEKAQSLFEELDPIHHWPDFWNTIAKQCLTYAHG